MKEDVLNSLAIATQFAHHATYAGTQRQAIAEGYSAIDASLSGLLHNASKAPPRNHKAKLDQVKSLLPNVFAEYSEKLKNGGRWVAGVPWIEVEAFYGEWLRARYEKFDVEPSVARERVAQANRAVEAAIRHIATEHGMPVGDLTRQVNQRAFGFEDCALYEALSAAHDHLFDRAERLGEEAGSKLGTKMAAATNFSMLDLIASDELTRDIIKNDEEIAAECASLHVQLCSMIERLRDRRADLLSGNGMDRNASVNESTNFMLALRFKYHGEKLSESGDNLGKTIAGLFGGGLAGEGKDRAPGD